MTAPSGKIPVLLTAVQVDLIGEALVEHISHLAYRLSTASQKKGATLEDVSLLKAYLELAKIIMDRNGVRNGGHGASSSSVRITPGRNNGPSPLQNPALRLRQP
jgi:hypothetical protein